jgi:hypothetical protein
MAGRTGYTATPATFDPQVHMDAIYAHFDPLIGETRANLAALPASGNWPGRQISLIDTRAVYSWFAGTGWAPAGDDTGWITPTLGAGWTAIGSETPRYRKKDGVVFLQGRATRSSGSAAAFTLPAGFVPDMQLVFLAESNGSSVRASIPLDGAIPGTVAAGAISAFSFGSMPHFLAAD